MGIPISTRIMIERPIPDTVLARACQIVGGQSAMARLTGKHQTTVRERLLKGGAIWPEHVLAIEAATGIPRHIQRPDIYPIEDPAAAVSEAAGELAPADPKSPAGADIADLREGLAA